MNIDTHNTEVKPFLKWAGGKRWLVPKLKHLVSLDSFKRYHEPFVGGGSMFFNLRPEKAFLSDSNQRLVETYESLKNDVDKVAQHLMSFKNDKENYYKIRNQKFRTSSKRSAQFIYLNQLSFNGIYRVNLKGEFNVPYGNRTRYEFDVDNLFQVSKTLKNTEISAGDFDDCLSNIQKGDLVFLDPPYTITHNQNGFVKYNQKIFSLEDQYRLSNLIDEIKDKGASYILTNAAHSKVKEIFDKNDRIIELERLSVVGGKKAQRGMYSEYIFTNIKA